MDIGGLLDDRAAGLLVVDSVVPKNCLLHSTSLQSYINDKQYIKYFTVDRKLMHFCITGSGTSPGKLTNIYQFYIFLKDKNQ